MVWPVPAVISWRFCILCGVTCKNREEKMLIPDYDVDVETNLREPGEEVAATLPSSWVREFIRKHGGVLNVAWRMVCRG